MYDKRFRRILFYFKISFTFQMNFPVILIKFFGIPENRILI